MDGECKTWFEGPVWCRGRWGHLPCSRLPLIWVHLGANEGCTLTEGLRYSVQLVRLLSLRSIQGHNKKTWPSTISAPALQEKWENIDSANNNNNNRIEPLPVGSPSQKNPPFAHRFLQSALWWSKPNKSVRKHFKKVPISCRAGVTQRQGAWRSLPHGSLRLEQVFNKRSRGGLRRQLAVKWIH